MPPVLQCQKCWRFRNTQQKCKKKETLYVECVDAMIEERECEIEQKRCFNCGDRHRSNFFGCIKYVAEKEIGQIAAMMNISISEARGRGANSNNHYRQARRVTYANVSSSNHNVIAEEPNEGAMVSNNKRRRMELNGPSDLSVGRGSSTEMMVEAINSMTKKFNRMCWVLEGVLK